MEPPRITVGELKERMDRNESILIIDTRSPDSWGASDVKLPGAIRVHYSEMEQRLSELPRDRPVVAYCT